MSVAVAIRRVTHQYGSRTALDDVSFEVAEGEIFGLLGPNGGGKTTLFRLLSTLVPLQSGEISVLGYYATRQTDDLRRMLGVVFQAPGLDKKLSVLENLQYHGPLYGVTGDRLRRRIDQMLEQLRLSDRRRDLVETLSGGLRRRVELAKGLLHEPRVLVLDEPSTGLDPGARADLWDYLRTIRREQGTTIILTTHLLEEADKADRLAILDLGRLVALDTPDGLRSTVGGDTLTIETDDAPGLAERVRNRFAFETQTVDGRVRLEQPDGHRLIAELVEAFPGEVRSIVLGKPTLEDVFIARTGRRFVADDVGMESDRKPRVGGRRR